MNLRITMIAGLVLLVISGGVLTFFYFHDRRISGSVRQQDSFYRILREYDEKAGMFYGTQREYDLLHADLDRLEKKAIGVESWLSILKRRKSLSVNHTPSMDNYRNSIKNARKAYPLSAPIAAIAASALVKDSSINREKEKEVRQLLQLFAQPEYNKMRLSLHVILGDFNNPENAAAVPPDIYSNDEETLAVNLAIIKTLRNDRRGALTDIQMILNTIPSYEAVNFAAEFHYDFGDLIRSAELFSVLKDAKSLARQADALYLAGFPYNAAAIWLLLSESDNEISLYNLASTAEIKSESLVYLEKLVNLKTSPYGERASLAREFGFIKHSRFLDYSDAIAILRNNKVFPQDNFPYIDLEICKRYVQSQNLGLQIAQTWLMLDRHGKNAELHRWAAWHFFFQRRFDEAEILLDRFELFGSKENWIDIYRALVFMNEGYLDTAENILNSLPDQDTSWDVCANLGRILENMRYPVRAIKQYETASAKLLALTPVNSKTASRMQVRIAKCLTAVNRQNDARKALLTALDLDPDNLSAQMELEKSF
ncbi:MAG: hypothetical protein FWB95_00020 [Treponema sp.]|nr:hypothetical protein [Treponema sp.]